MTRILRLSLILCLLGLVGCSHSLRINEIQFVGSHNSYKQAMSALHMQALRARNPAAADSLDYQHLPIAQQLDLGMRVLELDVFYDPENKTLPVGHVQVIDMNSHCANLTVCLQQVRKWSDAHPRHIPIWIMFNAKDQPVEGLPDPVPFDAQAFSLMDNVLIEEWGDRLIQPKEISDLTWPKLSDSRGKALFLLDEGGQKRELYRREGPLDRPMFTTVDAGLEGAGVMVINDPIKDQVLIRERVAQGYMVRTRADANTVEARLGDTRRRQAAFTSGAQAVSTDYYLPAEYFGTDYQVRLPAVAICNPVVVDRTCEVTE